MYNKSKTLAKSLKRDHKTTDVGNKTPFEMKYYWRIVAAYTIAYICTVLNLFASLFREDYLEHKGFLALMIVIPLMIVLLYIDREKHANRNSYRAAICLFFLTVVPSCFFNFGMTNKVSFLITLCMMSSAIVYSCWKLHRKNWCLIGQYTLCGLITEFILCSFFCFHYINGIHGAVDDCLLMLIFLLPLPIMISTGVRLIMELIQHYHNFIFTEITDDNPKEKIENEDEH